ncbi:PEGA domain-containing protein [Methanoculleus sp.]|uniref:PEGA domain-containing protein n=1 Tax=Methanoculleus sp. TaxID=90427 RepID=UPI001BD4D13F|nr:PEGA domain-containing protein [Methanoculleus sp.]
MDWIRARKYVETEPAFTYGALQTAPVVTTVAVTPSTAEVVEGETVQFTATAYDQYGEAMEGIAFNWQSINEAVGTVSADGVFSARAAGTTTVSAFTSTGGSFWGIAGVTVIHTVTAGSAWNWSTDGWAGWAHTASWTRPTGPCSEYGPVVVDDHGEHGVDVHLSAGAVIATVEHEFTDPSGVGWDSLTLVARVRGTDVPQGRWMTIEVNDEVVYAESGFSSSDPANLVPKEFYADFPQSETVRVKVSHGQNPAWRPHFSMSYYSLELHPSSAAPSITITSPWDDTVAAGGNVTVAGNVSDTAITSLTLTHNGVSSTIPVEGGNFSAEATLADANAITVGGTDSLGNPFSTTLLLDGDMLPAAYEQAIGFDPLDADSDCSQAAGDQSGNGVIDGYEIFAGDLPVFAKARIGADPFVEDTDGDGLTDSFELLKLGTFPEEPGQMLMMKGGGSGIAAAGTEDDPDGDGLSNLDEQTYGTDPLSADTDDDELSDAAEISMGTDPCNPDTDGDGLADAAETALGTDPCSPDSNGNGIPDGDEDYWSSGHFVDDTLDLTVFGRGYAVGNVTVAEVNYTHLISDEILVSKVYDIGFGAEVASGTIEIAYDPTHVADASRLSVYRFDEDLGTFVNVSSTVDAVTGVVSCDAAGSAKYAVLDSAGWDALFEDDLELFAADLELGILGTDYPYGARVRVLDSQTGEGVGGATVTFFGVGDGAQDLVTYTQTVGDAKGLTFEYAQYPVGGTHPYMVEKAGYKSRFGQIYFDDDESYVTAVSVIHQVDAPTGFLTVTSTPSAGVICYIDGIYYGSGISNVELLEGEHTLTLMAPGNPNYGTATRTVWITRNQYTQVHVDLPSDFGAVRVICSEPGATVFIDGFNVGTVPVSGELTATSVASGIRQVTVTKEGFVPYSEDVAVVSGGTSVVNAVLEPEDLDGDGLPDIYEENGYRDGFGNWHAPDPDLIDTDGDGLSDGYEAGEPITVDGKTYYKQRSDPTRADTDDDGLDDYLEDAIESDPLCADSDGDGLSDALEWNTVGTDLWSADTDGDGHADFEEWNDPDYDPLVYEERYGPLVMGREFLCGAVLGEWGADDHDNLFYLGGWVASGVIVIGDLRDIAATISRGDLIGTGLNLAALIPAYGDAAKVAEVVGKFVLKHPELLKPAMVLLVGVAPHVDEAAEAINAIRKAHGDDVIDRLLINGITENELKVVVRSNGNLLRTLAVVKRGDGTVIWLEEGKLGTAAGKVLGAGRDVGGTGWIHIQNNHVYLNGVNDFKKAFGTAYDDESLIKELILDCAKTGTLDPRNPVAYWKKVDEGHLLLVVIGDNGYLRTAYPWSLEDAPLHIQSMFS